MQKHKNSDTQNNNQLLLIGLGALIVLGATGILGAVIKLVIGLVVGVIGMVIGLVGAVIGAVVGIAGAIVGVVVGTAILWVPFLIIAFALKAMSGNDTPQKKKKVSVSE